MTLAHPLACLALLTLVPPAAARPGDGPTLAADAGGAPGTLVHTWSQPRRVGDPPPDLPPILAAAAKAAGATPAADTLAASFLSVDDDPEGDMPRQAAFTPDGAVTPDGARAVVPNVLDDTVSSPSSPWRRTT